MGYACLKIKELREDWDITFQLHEIHDQLSGGFLLQVCLCLFVTNKANWFICLLC